MLAPGPEPVTPGQARTPAAELRIVHTADLGAHPRGHHAHPDEEGSIYVLPVTVPLDVS